MFQFFKEEGVLVIELARLQERLLDPKSPFHFTKDQWYNRFKLSGDSRTVCTPAERIAMKAVLQDIRKEMATEK